MPVSTENNLLFGLLALQNGFVEQPTLVAAFHAWTHNKVRSIADILLGQGTIDTDERALLEGLAVKHLRRHGDDIEKSASAVSPPRWIVNELAEVGDPDLTTTLGHFAVSNPQPTWCAEADPAETVTMGGATAHGQRFRLLRPHAHGGLGAVFVALDTELNREVALKQILEDHADDPNSRIRFIVEAEITGGLEHPGIVPVYSLGSDGSGRPYYAMRFIRGDSLKKAIAAYHADPKTKVDGSFRSLALRKLLRRFIDVCNAIDYSHTRGVIHRDIKPSNVILGRHGETLVVDWGLARRSERPSRCQGPTSTRSSRHRVVPPRRSPARRSERRLT